MGRRLKILMGIGVGLIALPVSWIVGLMIFSPLTIVEHSLRDVRMARTQFLSKHQGEILAALDSVKENPLLAPYSNQKDAGPYLNPQIFWTNVDDQKAPSLEISIRLKDAYKRNRLEWTDDSIKKVNLQGVDFSWMKKLGEFDHWSIDRHALSLIPETERRTMKVLAERPSPRGEDLVVWAWARLILGFQAGNESEAFSEVFQLLRLMFSTEDTELVVRAGAWGTKLLGGAQEYLSKVKPEIAAAVGKFTFKDWKAQNTSRPLVFLAGNLRFYVGPTTPVDLTEQVRAAVPSVYCSAITESLVSDIIERSIATEPETARSRMLFASVLQTVQGCRLSVIRELWGDEGLQSALQSALTEDLIRRSARFPLDRLLARAQISRLSELTMRRQASVGDFMFLKARRDAELQAEGLSEGATARVHSTPSPGP